MRGFTEDEVLPFAQFAREHPFEVRFIEFMPLDADHAWTPDSVLSGEEIRAIIETRVPARARAARAERDGAGLPLRRRAGPHRVHQPGQRAVLRRLQPDPRSPPRASSAPASSRSTRPTCASRCAPGASDDELEQLIRDAVWRKELKHHVNEPGFIQPARTMSAIGG